MYTVFSITDELNYEISLKLPVCVRISQTSVRVVPVSVVIPFILLMITVSPHENKQLTMPSDNINNVQINN